MADEITLTDGMEVNGNGLVDKFQPGGSYTVTQTNARSKSGTQDVGTTAENLDVGDLTAPGYVTIKNLDATNFVEVGKDVSASFEEFVKIQPGKKGGPYEIADGVTPQVKFDTAAGKIQYTVFDK